MGRSRGHSSYARRYRLSGPKDFRMHSISPNAPSHKACSQIMQKCGGAAKVEIGTAGHAKLLDRGHVKMAGSIEVGPKPVLRTGPAVSNVTPAML